MAQVRARDQQDVDRQLSLALWQWGRLPEVEVEIDQWDVTDQLHFIEEWPLEEERLRRLERWAAEGLMTAEEAALYANLRPLVDENRPIIRRLQQT
jgi:hypothetical protein